MDVGIGLPNAVPGATGKQLTEWARNADQAGFSPPSGLIDRIAYPNLEPLVALGAAAAVTDRIQLATTILIAPYRVNAVLLAEAGRLGARDLRRPDGSRDRRRRRARTTSRSRRRVRGARCRLRTHAARHQAHLGELERLLRRRAPHRRRPRRLRLAARADRRRLDRRSLPARRRVRRWLDRRRRAAG